MTQAAVLAQMGNTNQTFRNRFINGGMVFDQRNAGASVTYGSGTTAGNYYGYNVDRWWAQNFSTTAGNGAAFTVQQSSSAPSGFYNSLAITVTSAQATLQNDSLYRIQQMIEGYNMADFGFGAVGAATITLSFWVKSNLTGTFTGCLSNNTDLTYPFTYTIAASNTWQLVSVTIAGATTGTWLKTNGIGLSVQWCLGAYSSRLGTANAWVSGTSVEGATGQTNLMATVGNTFYITGVQLEAGTKATPFEWRSYGAELVLCQRYYEKSFDQNTAPAHNVGGLPVVPIGSSLGCGGNAYWTIPFKVSKRVNNYSIRYFDSGASHTSTENWVRAIISCDAGTAYGPNSNMSFNALTTNQMAGYSQVGTGVPPIFYWTVDAEL